MALIIEHGGAECLLVGVCFGGDGPVGWFFTATWENWSEPEPTFALDLDGSR